MLDVTEKFKTKGYLVAIDIKKDFNSWDHSFLPTTLEKFGFRTNLSLISGLLDVTEKFKSKGYLVTIDIKKTQIL